MVKITRQGYGDESTWPPCSGHALDPRTESDDDAVICPECGSTDVDQIHHRATFATPECWQWICNACGHMGEPE